MNTRQKTLAKAATYGPRDFGGLTIYPLTMTTLMILEECGSGLFGGAKKITLRMLNELAFIHSMPPDVCAGYVPDESHAKRVAEFAAKVPMEHAASINDWLGEQINAFIQAQARAKK